MTSDDQAVASHGPTRQSANERNPARTLTPEHFQYDEDQGCAPKAAAEE